MNLNDKKKERINKRKAKRKNEILNIALEVFSEKGIDQTNMTDIAKASEVGVATLYRYFSNKTNLVIETGVEAWYQVNSKYMEEATLILNSEVLSITKLENLMNLFYKILEKQKPQA